MITRYFELMGSALVAVNGAITVTGFLDGGCIAAVAGPVASVYTLTLTPNQYQFENVCFIQIRGGAGNANAQMVWNANDQSMTVSTFVGAVATDEAFNIMICRVRRAA